MATYPPTEGLPYSFLVQEPFTVTLEPQRHSSILEPPWKVGARQPPAPLSIPAPFSCCGYFVGAQVVYIFLDSSFWQAFQNRYGPLNSAVPNAEFLRRENILILSDRWILPQASPQQMINANECPGCLQGRHAAEQRQRDIKETTQNIAFLRNTPLLYSHTMSIKEIYLFPISFIILSFAHFFFLWKQDPSNSPVINRPEHWMC